MKRILIFTVIMFSLLFPTFLFAQVTASSSGQFVPMERFDTCGNDLAINHFLYDKSSNIMNTVKDNCMKSPMLGSLNLGETKIVYAESNQEDDHEYINVYDIASKTTTTIYDLSDTERDDFAAYFDKNDKIIFNGDGTLKRMDADGKNITTIAEPEEPSHSFGMFWLSPGREKIIVDGSLKQVDDYHTGNYEILVMMNADGTGRQIIGEAYLGEWNMLAWRLDSKEVFFYHHIFKVVAGEYQGKTPQYFLIDLSGGTPGITDLSNLNGWKNKEENACFFTKSGNLLSFIDPKLYNGQTGALISVRSDVPVWTDAMLGIDNSGDIYFANLDGSNFRMFVESPTQTGTPKMSVSPRSLNFGSIKTGASIQKTVTIANAGTGQLLVNSISISGANATEFSQTNNCTAVAAKGTCTVTVTFHPTLPFGKKAASLTISSNDAKKGTTSVNLSGQVSASKISVKPSSLSFGTMVAGGTPVIKTVKVFNKGLSDLMINGMEITGTNASEFSQTNDCGTVQAGGTCTTSVTYTPSDQKGKKSALLVISSNDPKKPNLNVKLTARIK
jgi:hypothetical protein